MNSPRSKPDDKDDRVDPADAGPIQDRSTQRGRAKRAAAAGARERDKSVPADKGPGSASADTGMTSDGGYVEKQPRPSGAKSDA